MCKPFMASEGVLEPFCLKNLQALVQPYDEGDGRGEIRLIVLELFPLGLEIKIKLR